MPRSDRAIKYDNAFAERKARLEAEKVALSTPLQDGEEYNPLLKPGTHATVNSGSDCYPYEVIGSTYFVSGKKKGLVKTVTLRRLSAQAISGDYFAQDVKYEYTSNPYNDVEEAKAMYTRRGNGFLGIAKGYCGTVHFGVAEKRLDPHM